MLDQFLVRRPGQELGEAPAQHKLVEDRHHIPVMARVDAAELVELAVAKLLVHLGRDRATVSELRAVVHPLP